MPVELYDWKFAGDRVENRCPDIAFECVPPSACARHPDTGRNYCCDAVEGGGCWNQGNAGEDEEVTKACSTDSALKGWRCMKGSEECVRGERRNLCTLASREAKNPLPEIQSSVLEEVFVSLNSSDAEETYLNFDPSALITATQSSSSTMHSETTTSTPTPDTVEDETELSGSAIGGIVAGIVVGLALLGLGTWFLLRRYRRAAVPCIDHGEESKTAMNDHQQKRQEVELESRQIHELS